MLRARELDIRAQDNEAKRKDAEERLNLENMKDDVKPKQKWGD